MADPWAVQSVEAADPWAVTATAPAGTTRAQAPKAKPKRSFMDDLSGGAETLIRTVPFADEARDYLAAGVETTANLFAPSALAKAAKPGENAQQTLRRVRGENFKARQAQSEARSDSFMAAHPNVGNLLKGTGYAAQAAIPAGPTANLFADGGRLVNAARGATLATGQAAANAAGDRGSVGDRLDAASRAARDPATIALGAAAGGLAAPSRPGAVSRPRPAKAQTPQRVLADAGVQLTPGQKAGGVVKSVEDLAQRAPILGTAIRGARARGAESLNRVVALRALEPVDGRLPREIKTGHQAVEEVASQLGKVYDQAADMVPQVARDPELADGLARIERHIGELPTDVGAQYRNILKNRVLDRLDGKVLTGRELRGIQSEVEGIAAKRAASDDPGQQALGMMLEDVSDELKGLMGRFNPEAGKLIAKANKGWSRYVVLRSAASKAARGGVFTPGQLSTAVRTTDRSVGKGNVAKGRATLQDLSGAASEVMPDTFGNPGTADAVGLGALGMGVLTAPHQAIPVAAGLGAAAVPYFAMGRKVIEKLPANATRAELQAADRELAALAAKDPAVAALRRSVAARLARAVGVSGGARASQPANLFAQP